VIGGLVALIEPLANTVAYRDHEKAWTWFRGRSRRMQHSACALQG